MAQKTDGTSGMVLIVDDDEDLRALVSLSLTNAELSCMQAADGERGLVIARADPHAST